jgi:PBP1b-binding outer membrane lipoprotein LpoB
MQRDSWWSIMIRASTLLLLLLLAACSDEKPTKQAVNEMIESPLQNTVISSFEDYPPRPVVSEPAR